MRGMRIAGADAPCLGFRPRNADNKPGPYEWLTFGQVKDRATAIGSGLARLGLGPGASVGIFSSNCVEWSLVEHACYIYNLVSVPMYDTLGTEAVAHMTAEAEVAAVAIAPEKLADFARLWPQLPLVTAVVVFGAVPDGAVAEVPEGARLLTLAELEELGGADGPAETPQPPATPDSVCSICYTSGTTSVPKGAVITHMGFMSATRAGHDLFETGQCPALGPGDIHLSILPLAHCLERALHAVLTGHGVAIGFNQGDVRKIADDIGELRPTVLVGVPRIFNRIHDQVWAQVNARGGVAAALFKYAYRVKQANLRNNDNEHWLWDRAVFGAVRAKLGGRLRLVISGSAPISGEVLEFLRITLSTTVLEGYGLTEVSGPCTLSVAGDNIPGSIGPPLSTSMVKLRSVPEMGYTVDDKPCPRGEIMVKGHCSFSHYHKRPDLTAEAVDADGWFATGDIGIFDERGALSVVDRKKNIFKLSQGEYVAPERTEVVFGNCPLIDQIYIHGDSLQSVLVAIVVPNEDLLVKEVRASLAHLAHEPFAALCQNREVVQLVARTVDAWGRSSNLKGFEIPKAIHLEDDPFTIENGILTPTLKVKRPTAKERYAQITTALYASLKTDS
ncbi:medium-chain fatty acid-CoA ligase faa2 [Coemansia spiralis]|nr:medium-chain fatty acid-CoA ligase faa2 [Coemansia spiralis]